jgi:transposase
MMHQEEWMKLRAFKPLRDAGASWAEIARAAGCDWRTAKKYLEHETSQPPSYGPRRSSSGRIIDPYREVIDTWLRADPHLKASVIHERLAAEPYGFAGHYQRVKVYVRERRPEILAELGHDEAHGGFHARFAVTPGAQAQVDWGDEGTITTASGDLPVYSFHMVLSYSRDPFCRYTTSMDLATFWACHREAFAHFGGVPASILYDRTKTVVRRHVGRDEATPLHPEAVAFADHYGFAIRLCAPYRPQSKGRVERVVEVTRSHVLAGRTFSSVDQMQAAFDDWLPMRRAQVHRTHGEVIAVRGDRDRAALLAAPPTPYVVSERHIRTVGKDALVHFDASVYSVPWRLVRPRQKVELRVTRDSVAVWTLGADAQRLAVHDRAARKGSWVVNSQHWDGLPGHTQPHAGPTTPTVDDAASADDQRPRPWTQVEVAHRPLRDYDLICHERAGGGV